MTKTDIKGNKAKRPKALKTVDKQKTVKTFRMLNSDIKKLHRIANVKKATQTRVVSELIRLAYTGLFIPPMPQLNELYKTIVNEVESKETMNRDEIINGGENENWLSSI